MQKLLRLLPSVDACLSRAGSEQDLGLPHLLLKELIRDFLDLQRAQVRQAALSAADLDSEALWDKLKKYIKENARPSLRRLINGTGVVIHTNLGRSVLAKTAQQAVALAAGNYTNLEFDLNIGSRGSRHDLIRKHIVRLTGAEDGLAVNNNAAAVLLMLDSLAKGGEVIVSRGQLVEIGGSFRIPDVMTRSGAILREVGTTNRTHLADYQSAINENTTAILWVHTSNYRIEGFHSEVSKDELTQLAHDHNLPMLVDLGSGSLIDLTSWGLRDDLTVGDIIRSGADVVTFSGDKVLGGPQAGIIAGKSKLLQTIAHNQLFRALRCDKMTLAALEATLALYLDPVRAMSEIPTLRGITKGKEELHTEARALARLLKTSLGQQAAITMADGFSMVGGGSFPGQFLPTSLIKIKPADISVEELRQRLLRTEPPVVGRVEDDCFCLDPRTLRKEEYREIAQLFANALSAPQ